MLGLIIAGIFFASAVGVWQLAKENIEKYKEDEEKDRFYSVIHRIGNIGKYYGTGLHGRKPILGLLPPGKPEWTSTKSSTS